MKLSVWVLSTSVNLTVISSLRKGYIQELVSFKALVSAKAAVYALFLITFDKPSYLLKYRAKRSPPQPKSQ